MAVLPGVRLVRLPAGRIHRRAGQANPAPDEGLASIGFDRRTTRR